MATDDDLKALAEHGTYFDPQAGLVIENYLANKERFLGTSGYTEEGFVAMERALSLDHDIVRRAVKIPGLKVVFGTDALAGAHGRNAEEFIDRVRDAGVDPMSAMVSANSLAAEAMRMGDRIGSSAPGYKADIVMLDLDHPNWLPFNDPVNQLVHCEDGTAVASVMIGGRLVVDNRRVVTVDLDRLRDRVAAARERLAAANVDNRRLYEALEPVVGSHCPGLARTPYHVHRYGARLD